MTDRHTECRECGDELWGHQEQWGVCARCVCVDAEFAAKSDSEIITETIAALRDPDDDARELMALREAIDNHLGWESDEQEEAGDYLARVRQVGERFRDPQWRKPNPRDDCGEFLLLRMRIVEGNGVAPLRERWEYWVDTIRERESEDEFGNVDGVYYELNLETCGFDLDTIQEQAECVRISEVLGRIK